MDKPIYFQFKNKAEWRKKGDLSISKIENTEIDLMKNMQSKSFIVKVSTVR